MSGSKKTHLLTRIVLRPPTYMNIGRIAIITGSTENAITTTATDRGIIKNVVTTVKCTIEFLTALNLTTLRRIKIPCTILVDPQATLIFAWKPVIMPSQGVPI